MSVQEKMTALADAIRGRTGITDALTLDEMTVAISGMTGNSVLEELTITENGEYTPGNGVDGFSKVTANIGSSGSTSESCSLDYATNIQYMFQYGTFDNTDLVLSFGSKVTEHNTNNSGVFPYAFYKTTGLKSVKINCGFPLTRSVSFNNAFGYAGSLETVDLSGIENLVINSMNRCFGESRAIKEIIGDLDISESTANGNAFAYCYALKEVRFVPGSIIASLSFIHSASLSDASVQSIIDGLADRTDSTAQNLTLAAAVKGNLTEAQIAAITGKNWTLS